MGNIDGATWAVLCGQASYPRVDWMLKRIYKRNHPSWEQEDVKRVLGPKFAAYLVQGALEGVPHECSPPTIINPTGAVDKKGPDRYRAIADAREANKGVGDWGVRLFTIRDVADLLDWCSFMAGEDMGDAYHATVFPGCTGELVWGWGIVGVEDYEDDDGETGQRFVWGWRLHVGCWPWDCLHTCEKSCSGVCLDGFYMRWAVAHFGQKCAGSPLNVIALCLLRYLARRGAGRSSSVRAIQGGVWVDDFQVYLRVGCAQASAVPRAHGRL